MYVCIALDRTLFEYMPDSPILRDHRRSRLYGACLSIILHIYHAVPRCTPIASYCISKLCTYYHDLSSSIPYSGLALWLVFYTWIVYPAHDQPSNYATCARAMPDGAVCPLFGASRLSTRLANPNPANNEGGPRCCPPRANYQLHTCGSNRLQQFVEIHIMPSFELLHHTLHHDARLAAHVGGASNQKAGSESCIICHGIAGLLNRHRCPSQATPAWQCCQRHRDQLGRRGC